MSRKGGVLVACLAGLSFSAGGFLSLGLSADGWAYAAYTVFTWVAVVSCGVVVWCAKQ